MQQKSVCLVGLVITGLLLTGCAAFQTSTTQNLPVATEAKPPSNKVLITVEGTPSYSGIIKLYAIKVYDDKTLAGKVGPNGKLVWLRDPGRIVLTLGDDSVYGADWCLGRVHTVAAGEAYNFNIKCQGGQLYSIAGPGVSVEDEQTGKFLAVWKQLRSGMSDVEVFRLLGGYQIDSGNISFNEHTKIKVTKYGVSWYWLQCKLEFYQGKLSDWKMICPKCHQEFVTPTEAKDGKTISCPACPHLFFPTKQE